MQQNTIRHVPAAALLSALSLACGDPDQVPGGAGGTGGTPGTGGTGATTGAPVCEGGTELVISDDTNYSFSNILDIKHDVLKDATDLSFDWSGLTTDLFGRAMSPTEDVDTFLIALMGQTPEQIEAQLKVDGNLTSYNKGAISAYPDGMFTSQNLVNFTLLGEDLPEEDLWAFFDTSTPDYKFDPATHTFLVMAQAGTEPGKNALMLHMFTLDPTSTQTSLTMTNDSTEVSYMVELETAQARQVPLATPNLSVQWNQMTQTALGNQFVPTQVTQAAIAHYSMTRAELEGSFLDLEALADGWWSGQVVAGTSINLSTLVDEAGDAFPGISADGTWMVALFCTKACNNPAPWSITFLEPCPE